MQPMRLIHLHLCCSAGQFHVQFKHQTCLRSNTNKSPPLFFLFFKEKFRIFSFFSVSFCSQGKRSQNISTQLPEKGQITLLCSRNTSLALNGPRIQHWAYRKSMIRKLTLHQQEVQTCIMCHPKPRTGHVLTRVWKTNNPQNMSGNIHDCILFFFSFSCCHMLKI